MISCLMESSLDNERLKNNFCSLLQTQFEVIALFYIAGRDHERGGVISLKVLPVESIRLSVHS